MVQREEIIKTINGGKGESDEGGMERIHIVHWLFPFWENIKSDKRKKKTWYFEMSQVEKRNHGETFWHAEMFMSRDCAAKFLYEKINTDNNKIGVTKSKY